MTPGPELRTERLLLRRWKESDLEPFAALNADPVVMEHLIAPLSRQETAVMIDTLEQRFEDQGYGLWAVEVLGGAPFVGFVGLNPATFEATFTPAVEVGWRLARAHWGHGYATEAARAALQFGFDEAGLTEIVSFTSAGNLRSQRVMDRLGMTRDAADDFDHPRVPHEHPARRHVLYRLRRPG